MPRRQVLLQNLSRNAVAPHENVMDKLVLKSELVKHWVGLVLRDVIRHNPEIEETHLILCWHEARNLAEAGRVKKIGELLMKQSVIGAALRVVPHSRKRCIDQDYVVIGMAQWLHLG